MFQEGGVIESLQVAAWGLAAATAIGLAFRRRPARERFFGAWLALLCILAALRESDAHIWLNPETIGDWGVRYRIDWWTSASSPTLPRLLWVVIGVLVACGLIGPLLRVRPRFITLLLGRDRAILLFALAALAMFGGYACDDLVGRGQFVDPRYSKAAEETLELFGALFFMAGVACFHRRPLADRERTASARRSTPHA